MKLVVALLLTASSAFALDPVKTDPAPNQTPALSFAEAYERILGRNLDIQTQKLNVEASRAKKLLSVGAFTPSLSLVGNEVRDSITDPRTRESAALALKANLFSSGTDFAALKAANRDIDASEETLKAQGLKAEDDAVSTLINFIARSRQRDLISQIVTIKQDTVKIAKERYNKGLLPQQEVDKIQIDLDNSQARLIDADINLAAARASVSASLGAFQNVNLDWPWKGAIVSGPRTETLDFKLENRPDFRASLQSLEAESWRRHAARSQLLPSLDLIASYGSNDLSVKDQRDWSAMLTLTIPIFERFQGYSVARLQTLKKQQAEIQRELITRAAGVEIESYRVGFVQSRESAIARERTAKLTKRLFNDNVQRFRLGRADANELAIDQARLLETEILEVEGWSSAHLSFVRLCHALGRNVTATGSCQ